jgi:hypothetical protein
MAIAAIQPQNLQIDTLNNANHSSSIDSMNLDNLVDPMSSDISAFHSTVQQSILQNATISPSSNSTFSASSAANVVLGMVDSIQNSHRKIQDYANNATKLTAGDAVELQETAESMSLTTQFLSKGMTLATKAIDQIVHMQ